jgi:hypothetical protein
MNYFFLVSFAGHLIAWQGPFNNVYGCYSVMAGYYAEEIRYELPKADASCERRLAPPRDGEAPEL